MNLTKHKMITISVLLFATVMNAAVAQDSLQNSEPGFLDKFPDYILDPATWLGIFLFLVISFVIYGLAKTSIVLSRLMLGPEKKFSVEPSAKIKKERTWNKLVKKMTGSVPVEYEADVMLDHNYDGIRELDNQLPPWWKWGFILTICFAFFYLFSYHVAGTGKLSLQEYADELKQAQAAKEERMKIASNNITETNVIVLTEAGELGAGKNIYEKNCVACHGNLGQGNVGPNLTDEFWLHGGGIKNVFNTITTGVPNKGMISWKAQLAPKQIQEVASFVLSMAGTNPPGAKESQGEKWIEESKVDSGATVMKDSTAIASKKL
jgi:cytochrome c oxidase cbb3-type subunit 3